MSDEQRTHDTRDEDEEVPEADRSEQRRPAVAEPESEFEPGPSDEAPTPDELDQSRAVRATAWMDPPVIADDVPEADALDQARAVPLDEDDDR